MRSVPRSPLPFLAIFLVATVAMAGGSTPSVTLSSPGASPTDDPAAVCTGDATTVDVQVDATANFSGNTTGTYGAFGTCYACDAGPYANSVTACNAAAERYAVRSKTDITVTPGAVAIYANGSPLSLDSGSTYTGTIAANTTEGSHDVDFTATIAETYSNVETIQARTFANNGACPAGASQGDQVVGGATGPGGGNGTEDAPTSASYLVDLEAPTLTHTLQSGTVVQNGTLFYDFTASGGSAGTSYSLKATASGPASLDSTDGPFSFGASATGIAGDAMETVGLTVGCAPTGAYDSGGELTASDLCGDSWGAIGSSSSPGFDVDPDAACAGLGVNAVVSAPLESDNYETVDCFESKRAGGRGRPKTVTSPGTVHAGAVVNMPDGAGDCSETASGIHLTITKDSDFDWTMSGGSPAAHVFVGDASGGFFLHSGYPLVEYTGVLRDDGRISGGTSNGDDDIDMDLSNLDVGCGAGEIPHGWTVYARAHVRFNRNNTPDTDVEHLFSASAFGDGLPTEMGDYPVWENPTAPVCVNGQQTAP